MRNVTKSFSNTSIVVDASAIIQALLKASLREIQAGRSLHAPYLIDIEVLHALRRMSLARVLDDERASEAILDFADLRMDRFPHERLIPRIWSLRDNFSAYDAAYVALAEILESPLVTCDVRLAHAAAKFIDVEVAE